MHPNKKCPQVLLCMLLHCMHNNKNTILKKEEREEYEIIKSCIEGDFTNQEAAGRLGLKIRRVQYLKRQVEQFRQSGVVHKLKNQPLNP